MCLPRCQRAVSPLDSGKQHQYNQLSIGTLGLEIYTKGHTVQCLEIKGAKEAVVKNMTCLEELLDESLCSLKRRWQHCLGLQG